MLKDIAKSENLEKKILKLPSTSNNMMEEIVEGLYTGKPLLGAGRLLTQLVKDLTQLSLQGEMDAHLAENAFRGRWQ